MNFSLLADVESAFESFFANLTSSTTFNLIFFLGLGLELFLILLFAIKSRFSYEARMRRSLDTLNRWLFKYKTLDKDNIKEFNNMVKKAPKRLAVNWQQYILYREKAPSEYMSVENIIEKPLRTSSYALNIKNLVWFSVIWMLVVFVLGISYNNISNTVLNATMIIIALVAPIFMLLMCAIAVVILQARKSANLDELYQNLHLFDRFIIHSCSPQKRLTKAFRLLENILKAEQERKKKSLTKLQKKKAWFMKNMIFQSLESTGRIFWKEP